MKNRGCLFSLVAFAIILTVLWWAFPPVRNAWFTFQLMRDTMPAHLPVPVAGIRMRQLQDTWGGMRSGGRRHEGIDIFATRGTPILSATRGLVVKRGENELGGNVISVLGPGGYTHYYAHLHDWGRFEAGDRVKTGDTLGFVGTSGNARGTPPHLHYGIYKLGTGAVNPYPWLMGRGGEPQ